MSKKKYPDVACPVLSDIIKDTAAKRIQWNEEILAGSRQTKVLATSYKGWNLTIENNFLWASADGSLIPLGEAYEIIRIVATSTSLSVKPTPPRRKLTGS